MYKVTKRDCPMFGIGPYVCEFICDTASDISTLPTSISEGTGGRTAYDNQKCASGSIAIIASGSESKQYMLNNKDIWCPYSVAAGSSSGGSSESSITVDFALSETSENPVANKAIVTALNNKANVSDLPDLSAYALKSKYGNTTIDVGRKSGTTVGVRSTAEGYNTTASGNYSHAEGYNTTASGHYSHAEGYDTTASGNDSHAEGYDTTASGSCSHAEGYSTTASGSSSHTSGYYTKALHNNEVAFGCYNESNDDTLFSVGDGTSDTARHNAFEITTTGGKLHDKDIATTDLIPTSLPANGGNADTVNSLKTDVPNYLDIFSTTLSPSHPCWNKKCSIYGQTNDINAESYLANAPEISIAVWYEVETIGNIGRAYQIAHGCYYHQRKSFIRYMHDAVWSDWKNIADGGDANTVGGKDPGKIFYDNGMSSDLNSATKSGCYSASPETLNIPLSSWWLVETMNYNNQFIVQKAYMVGDMTHTSTYVRNYANNAWSVWSEISSTSVVSTNTE